MKVVLLLSPSLVAVDSVVFARLSNHVSDISLKYTISDAYLFVRPLVCPLWTEDISIVDSDESTAFLFLEGAILVVVCGKKQREAEKVLYRLWPSGSKGAQGA